MTQTADPLASGQVTFSPLPTSDLRSHQTCVHEQRIVRVRNGVQRREDNVRPKPPTHCHALSAGGR